MLEELLDVTDHPARENRGEKALRLVPLDFLEFTVLRAAGLLRGQEIFSDALRSRRRRCG